MVQDFNLDNFNILDIKAKKVLTSLSEFDNCLIAKRELIHERKGLLPEEINDTIRNLKVSLTVNLSYRLTNLPPYNFYAVEIADFRRKVRVIG